MNGRFFGFQWPVQPINEPQHSFRPESDFNDLHHYWIHFVCSNILFFGINLHFSIYVHVLYYYLFIYTKNIFYSRSLSIVSVEYGWHCRPATKHVDTKYKMLSFSYTETILSIFISCLVEFLWFFCVGNINIDFIILLIMLIPHFRSLSLPFFIDCINMDYVPVFS